MAWDHSAGEFKVYHYSQEISIGSGEVGQGGDVGMPNGFLHYGPHRNAWELRD